MIKMKSIGLFFSLVLTSIVGSGQIISNPTIWLRADSACLGAAFWHDVSGNNVNVVPSLGTLPDTFSLMNFNKCFHIDGNGACYLVPLEIRSRNIDAIMVYKTDDSTAENGLWYFPTDSASVGLTTHRILSDHGIISYDTVNRHNATTNYVAQSWDTSLLDSLSLHIGRVDTIPFQGQLSEFVFFNQHIGDSALTQWLSYLAIKYGITLHKRNYLDSKKRCIWNSDTFSNYSYSIAGIGRDDGMGLFQKQTLYADGAIIFGMGTLASDNESNPSYLEDGTFAVVGMDCCALDNPTQLYISNGDVHSVIGRSMIQITGEDLSNIPTFLNISKNIVPDSLAPILIIDRSGSGEYPLSDVEYVYPDIQNLCNSFVFSNLHWDIDGNGRDAFCFSVSPSEDLRDNATPRAANADGEEQNIQGRCRYSLTPNPNDGHYRLEIELNEISDVTVTISTTDGKNIRTLLRKGDNHYVINGYEATPGAYFVEIISKVEHQTLKMIIK